MTKIPTPNLSDSEKRMVKRLKNDRRAVFNRFPLLFTLLGTFGLVATFYGFERIIDRIPIFADHPWILLGTGILILYFTGTLYKRLQ